MTNSNRELGGNETPASNWSCLASDFEQHCCLFLGNTSNKPQGTLTPLLDMHITRL